MRIGWAWLACACAFSIACEGATSRDLEPIPRDEYVAAYARAFCESQNRCCVDGTSDVESCIALVMAGMADNLGLNGAISYDPLAAAACVDGTRNRRCVWPPEIPVCGKVVAGTVAEGGSCESTPECAHVSGRALECSDGVCTNVRRKLGEPCSQTCLELGCAPYTLLGNCYTDDGLYCRSADSVCAEILALGAPCDEYPACGNEYDAACLSGVCKQTPKLGQACTGKGTLCEEGAYCDGQSCQPKQAIGAACDSDWGCLDGACKDGHCTTPRYPEHACF